MRYSPDKTKHHIEPRMSQRTRPTLAASLSCIAPAIALLLAICPSAHADDGTIMLYRFGSNSTCPTHPPASAPAGQHSPGKSTPWTWQDGNGVQHTRADLDAILRKHRDWLNSNTIINPVGRIDLTRAHLQHANLSHLDLSGARLAYADLSDADLTETKFETADLTGVSFDRANLCGANLFTARLDHASFTSANLNSANLQTTTLNSASFEQTDLHDTDFGNSDLTNVDFAPGHLPPAGNIGNVTGLATLFSIHSPAALLELRKALHDSGYDQAQRQVNASIHRYDQNALQRLIFDDTCEWGSNWTRPLKIAAGLFFLCGLIYWIGLRFRLHAVLYLIAKPKGKERQLRIGLQALRPTGSRRARRRWERKLLGTAFLFSLTSVLNLGFQGFDFGRYIRMLHTRDFDLRARGWMRTLSGIQSLLGLALVAMSLLSYFGHPFE